MARDSAAFGALNVATRSIGNDWRLVPIAGRKFHHGGGEKWRAAVMMPEQDFSIHHEAHEGCEGVRII